MNNMDLKFLRDAKRERMIAVRNLFEEGERELVIEKVSSAIVIPPGQGWTGSGVFSDAGLHRFSSEVETAGEEEYIRNVCASEGEMLDAVALFAGRLNLHWGHFITESLSSLWPLFISGAPNVDKIIFTLNPGESARIGGNIKKVLELTGLYDKMVFTERPLKVKSLIIAESAVYPRHHFSSQSKPLYDHIGEQAMKECGCEYPPLKIYLSRAKLKKAALNEPGAGWLDEFFRSNGYHILYPEQLDFCQTVGYIRNAEEVVAVSGTLPHNMLFARDGQKLTIIDKMATLNAFQPGINLMRRLDVTWVDAGAVIWSVDPGLGPFVIYPTECFKRFAESKGMNLTGEWSASLKRKVLRKYIRVFRRHYGYSWPLNQWEESEISLIREAYRESMEYFGEWISGRKNLFLSDLFLPRNLARTIYRFFKSKGRK